MSPASCNPIPERYLEFTVGDYRYGVPLDDVREVIGVPQITPVPQSHPSFRGIVNLRGQIIPVYDLRRRFDLPDLQRFETSIIICRKDEGLYGTIVDSVDRVVAVEPTNFSTDELPSANGRTAKYVRGIYKDQNRLVLMIHLAEVVGVSLMSPEALAPPLPPLEPPNADDMPDDGPAGEA